MIRRNLAPLAIGLTLLGAGVGATAAMADKPPNIIVGTPSDDWLIGTKHPDVIFGRTGNDLLAGRSGNDQLRGGRGNDRLYAWGPHNHSGVDILNGGRGDHDRCVGDPNDIFRRSCEVIIVRG